MQLRQQRGQDGEAAAARLLQERGYRIIARNWRPGNGMRGEVDCIAWHGQTLCFIEVKARTALDHGWPQEAVTATKQRQLSRLANAYVCTHRLSDTPCRFDVVEVLLGAHGAPSRLRLCANAFDYCADRSPHRPRRF